MRVLLPGRNLVMAFVAALFLVPIGASTALGVTQYTTTPLSWDEKYTYYQIGSSVTDKGTTWVEASRKSAAKWSNHHNSDVALYGYTALSSDFYYSLQTPYNSQQYDHTLGFSDLATGVLGLTTQSGVWEDGWINGVDNYWIRFNTDYEFTTDAISEPQKYCYHSVAVHELGHALGLGHPVGNKNDWTDATRPSMYGAFGVGEIWGRTLSQGDRDGVTAMYGTH